MRTNDVHCWEHVDMYQWLNESSHEENPLLDCSM